MTTIDIRTHQIDPVTTITFADYESTCFNAVEKAAGPYLKFGDETSAYVITSISNIPNLILALQKAVELGWTK